MSDAEWITFEEAVEIVRVCLGASIGRSGAVMKTARASGEVRFQNPADPVLLLADDGLVGMNLRQDKAGVTADGRSIIHRTSSANMSRISKDDLLDWLGRQPFEKKQAVPPARRGGRPPAHNWPAIDKAAIELMDENGDFSVDDPDWNAQARLEEALNDRFSVGISTLRGRLPNLLSDWRKTKVGN
jgi:hypothetical protein